MAQVPSQDKISQSSTQTRTHRGLVSELGDGYKQVVKDGTNDSRSTWNLVWEGLNEAEKNTLDGFLNGIGNWDVFQWRAFGDANTKDWRIIESHSVNTQGGDVYTISTQVEEFF